ncbi:hypothetical protein OA067_03615 [Gammaproteobacteria bacterium]|nr:hypothetical protein [Gammaproteobacteria bacterium]
MKIVEREGDKIYVMGKVTLDNLSDFCRGIKNALKKNDIVLISFESLDSQGSAILPLLIFLRRQEKQLSAKLTFKCCSTKFLKMAKLAGLSEGLGI